MPDFLKKASRQTRRECAQDEEPLAALFVRPRNGEDIKRLGAPGGALSKVGKLADHVDSSDSVDSSQAIDDASGEQATTDDRIDMFGQNAVLVLTDRSLMAFGHGTYTGRVKRLIGQVPLSTISEMSLDTPEEGEKGAALLLLSFVDDTTFAVTPGSRRKRFLSAFEELAQPAES